MQQNGFFRLLFGVILVANLSIAEKGSPSPTALPSTSTARNASATTSSASGENILTTTEFELFQKSLILIKDLKCRSDLNATLRGILAGHHWAIAMFDATTKSAFGIESGVQYQFGHFDECLAQRRTIGGEQNGGIGIPVRAKYCLTDVVIDGLTVQNVDTRSHKLVQNTVVHWGACVPASCEPDDITIYLETFLQRSVTVKEEMCQFQAQELQMTGSMFVYAVVIFSFIFLAILSTSYQVYLSRVANRSDGISKTLLKYEILNMALLSFSVIENTKKMFQASKDQLGLNCINGIKALAMLLILTGHVLSFIFGGPLYNPEFMSDQVKNPFFAFISNSLLFVDTFLLLSGFLFCRILLIELERRRGKLNVLILYVARYIRLTPAYVAVMGFYITWFPSVGSGPLWQQRIGREQERCEASWYWNILYVNNYINTDKLCMFQSWYLSVDTQLFFVAPIVIYLLYKSRKYGLQLLGLLVVCTALIPFAVTYLRRLDPTLLVYSDEMTDLSSNAFFVGSYIKTHMRASAYFVGLLTGYLVHLMQESSMKLNPTLVRLGWLASVAIGVASMFSVTRFYMSPFSNVESTMYAGFHKVGWNLSVAWLVLATTTGHAGQLQALLSARFFAPISRLTYCAYLANGIVELYHSASIRVPNDLGYINLANKIFGHTMDTFLLAFILCLLFESPIHALERILLRSNCANPNKKSEKASSQTPSTSEENLA